MTYSIIANIMIKLSTVRRFPLDVRESHVVEKRKHPASTRRKCEGTACAEGCICLEVPRKCLYLKDPVPAVFLVCH